MFWLLLDEPKIIYATVVEQSRFISIDLLIQKREKKNERNCKSVTTKWLQDVDFRTKKLDTGYKISVEMAINCRFVFKNLCFTADYTPNTGRTIQINFLLSSFGTLKFNGTLKL